VKRLGLTFPPPLEGEFLHDYVEESLPRVRVALVVAVLLLLLVEALDSWVDTGSGVLRRQIRYGAVCAPLLLLLAFTWSRRFRDHMQPAIAVTSVVVGFGLIAMGVVSSPPVERNLYLGVINGLLFVYMLTRLRFAWATAVGWIVTIAYLTAAAMIRKVPLPLLVNDGFFLLSVNVMAMLGSYSIEHSLRRDFLRQREIEAERERSDQLLLNVLPASIAERLKRGEASIAEAFDEATVLFADLVDFTPLAERMAPGELVALLNEVFSAFDGVAERLGVEKVKTMGDAYMIVGGLPIPRADHAEAVAEAALEMLGALAALSAGRTEVLRLRIGIHSGPVVAGVIGRRKFNYDLWGDTVNTASRMQTHGVIDAIQVTPETYRRLRNAYVFEERGRIEVKGKGMVTTYLLTGRKPASAAPRAAPTPAA
jgi:class 3 adenylate cyclase